MPSLAVPINSVVLVEEGSGGALRIGVCDRLLMLEFSTYSVISPEGCASILWKSADKAETAASAMKITSSALQKNGLVDEVLSEPLGGAHRNVAQMAEDIQDTLVRHLSELRQLSAEELQATRDARLRSFGRFRDA